MGLFSGKKKTVAQTSYARMIGDADIKSAAQQAMFHAIFTGADIPLSLREASASAMDLKLDRFQRWASIAGNYTYGAPIPLKVDVDPVELRDAIVTNRTSHEGTPVTAVYTKLSSINHYHMAWDFLQDNYGYSPRTNQITSTLGVPIYVKDIVIHYYSDILSRYTLEGLAPLGWSGLSGVTQSRAQDLNAAFNDYVIDAPTHDYAKVTYTCRGTYRTTRTVIVDRTTVTANDGLTSPVVTDTPVSDTTTAGYDFTEPTYTLKTDVTLGVDASPSPTTTPVSSTDDGTNTTVVERITTPTVTVDTYDYEWSSNNSFLAYEPSGVTTVLDGSDTTNINPGLEAPAPTDVDYDWAIMGYTYDISGVTHVGYFTYAFGSNLEPSIEALLTTLTTTGSYYPRLYARLDGTKLNTDSLKTTDAYKTSKVAARKLGINYGEWIDDIHDNIGSLDKVWGIALGFSVPLNTTNQLDREYLFRFFSSKFDDLNPGVLLPTISDAPVTTARKNTTTLAIKDNALTQTLDYQGIGKHSGIGTGFIKGTYSSSYGQCYSTYTNIKHGSGYTLFPVKVSYHAIRFYTSTTTFDEYVIIGCNSSSQVSGGYWSSAVDDSNDLMVPLDHSISRLMARNKLEKLTQRSAYLIINTLVDIKTPWYATGLFQVVVLVVLVVINIITLGASTPLTVAAVTSMLVTMVIEAIIVAVVVNIVLRIALALGLDPKIAAVIATIAAIYATKGAGTSGYLQTAKGILEVTNLALQTYATELGMELKGVLKDMQSLIDTQKRTLDEYADKLNSMVDMTKNISIDDLRKRSSSTLINLGESPNSFYGRTSVIDVSDLVYGELLSYHAMKLQVPDMVTSIMKYEENA